MKHLFRFPLILAVVISFIMAGCKKYEDGDTFSLLCKTYIVNDWKIEKRFHVNTNLDITPTNNYWIEFKPNYKFSEHQADTVSSEGTWALDGKKEQFILIPDQYYMGMAQIGVVYTIIRLENKRFRIQSNSTDPIETHYIPK
ncbi:MAG TPA: hypothetical protein PKW80_13700 [Bacteroidales bacterium]|nr:hypothetical protein [Bacteroidales bacterium]